MLTKRRDTRVRRLTLIAAGVAALALTVSGVAIAEEVNSNGWPIYGGDYANTHYSKLDQINTSNVKDLTLAWVFSLGTLRSNESTPIVVNDTLYVSSSLGPKYVYALNAKTGEVKWIYRPSVPQGIIQYACCDVNNRGVSYSDGKIFVGRLDGMLVALDASTGKELWKTQVVDYKQGSVITSPPLVVGNKVIIGFGGGEYGARGSLQAYDASSGKLIWRTYTTMGPGEPGNDTWKGDSWKRGGGAAWLVGSYDPQNNIVYYGTSNPGPWDNAIRGPDSSNYGKYTNEWTSAVVALNADTGKILWGYSYTPYDAWDYDGVNEPILTDLEIGGKNEPVMLEANRNGFFYVLNRVNGKFISAQPFVPVNWAEAIDQKTGRPIEVPKMRPTRTHKVEHVCPNFIGGKNWQPMSYDPDTKLVYMTVNNLCANFSVSPTGYHKGMFYLGKSFETQPGPGEWLGKLIAWNPVTQKALWEVKEKFPYNGGVLTTAGGLVMYTDWEGHFKALDAKTGQELFRISLGTGAGAGPVAYSVNGKEYIAQTVGRNQSIPPFLAPVGTKMLEKVPEGGAVFVFTLR